MNLAAIATRHDGIALVHAGDHLTYGDLRDSAAKLADELSAAGVRSGDVVSILLPNEPRFVVCYLACWSLGAVANPLNSRLSATEIAAVAEHAGSRVVVTSATTAAEAGAQQLRVVLDRGTAPHWLEVGESEPARGPGRLPVVDVATNHPAVLIYTSGTTSAPKGVLLSHDNLRADASGIASRLGIASGYRTACFMPLFHCNALIFSHLSTFFVGGSVLLLPKFSASRLLDEVERWECHSFSCPPTVLAMLLDRVGADRTVPPSLGFVKVGAAPLSDELAQAFESRFRIGLIEGYGMTEGTATSVMHDPRIGRPGGTLGFPLPEQQVRIVREDGTEAGTGEVGEIEIGGATVMLGYHRDPELTRETMNGRWLRTGDLGSLDPDGHLRLAGRRKELIIRGGENIHPAALDQVLETHPSVTEGAVYGVPDPIWGESPAAAVVLRPGTKATDLRDYVAERVADFALPVCWRVVDTIPRNAVGKVQRHLLRAAHLTSPGTELDLTDPPLHVTGTSQKGIPHD